MYKPGWISMGDMWFLPQGDLMHMFYLNFSVPPRLEMAEESIGHATSRDLITWEDQPNAVERGAPGEWDDQALWTGSVIAHGGRFLMLYTGISSQDRIQRTGAAFSDDLYRWEKLPENPIMSPDPLYYEINDTEARGGWTSWRDPWLIWDGDSETLYATITARIKDGDFDSRGCIALARSHDGRQWEVLPPLTAPGLYEDMEVSQLYEAQGLWYLTHFTWDFWYGEMARIQIPEDQVQSGTHYLTSHDWLGGWRVPLVDVFAGSKGEAPTAGKIVDWCGKRLFLHWGPHRRALALPKELLVAENGSLGCGYYAGLDAYREGALFASPEPVRLEGETRPLAEATNFILQADVTVESGRAGLLCAARGAEEPGFAVLLDPAAGRVEMVRLGDGAVVADHPWELPEGQRLSLRLVSDADMVDFFINDRFVLAFQLPCVHAGQVGVCAPEGAATFAALRADKTRVPVVG